MSSAGATRDAAQQRLWALLGRIRSEPPPRARGGLRLSHEAVEFIKGEHAIPSSVLAWHLGISHRMVNRIRAGRAWGRSKPLGVEPRAVGVALLQGPALERAIRQRRQGWSYRAIATANGTMCESQMQRELIRAIGYTKPARHGRRSAGPPSRQTTSGCEGFAG